MKEMLDKRKQRKELTYNLHMIPLFTEVGAGRVVPFVPREKLIPVSLPSNVNPLDAGAVVVCGCSLEDLGIFSGDMLIFTKKFAIKDAMFNPICIVHIISTGELVAKKILPAGQEMLTLRASGGGIKDLKFHRDDIEVKGLAIGYQRMFGKDFGRDPSIPF